VQCLDKDVYIKNVSFSKGIWPFDEIYILREWDEKYLENVCIDRRAFLSKRVYEREKKKERKKEKEKERKQKF
jgi:hypothetical protein